MDRSEHGLSPYCKPDFYLQQNARYLRDFMLNDSLLSLFPPEYNATARKQVRPLLMETYMVIFSCHTLQTIAAPYLGPSSVSIELVPPSKPLSCSQLGLRVHFHCHVRLTKRTMQTFHGD